MSRKELVKFTYVKKDGSAPTNRTVFPITMPSDKVFGIDLSEFNEEEQELYRAALEVAHKEFLKEIEEMGLSSCYRYFKEDGIIYEDSST